MNRHSVISRHVPALFLLLVLVACSGPAEVAVAYQRTAPEEEPALRATFNKVREVLSGQRALEVVAFVAPHWRVAGNAGFDASIQYVADVLEQAGYVREDRAASGQALTYRVEQRPMTRPTWEPVEASVEIIGQEAPLLHLASNRNMLAINSYSTPQEGIEADVVYVGAGRTEAFDGVDVEGKIVFGETSVGRLFVEAVQKRGALGVLAYRIAPYTQPEKNQHSIQFSGIPLDQERRAWGILLSYAARSRLKAALEAGPVRVRVSTRTRIYEAEERTLIADVAGSEHPDERFVFSAHVQEPGANDNASGVGALAEIARATAELVRRNEAQPRRTITFIWGDEIRSTRRYIVEDSVRAEGIRWGMSLDMVGEDTDKTGGTFLIEKMPDPSAIWTRGDDQHSEWGGRPLNEEQMTPHYFNDFVINRCMEQAAETGWVVKTNPYEGGSDHIPFLQAGKPGLLLWHFTDAFYHTDGDLIDKVSSATLENVGVCALTTALTLSAADGAVARAVVAEVERAALARLEAEGTLSRQAIAEGADPNDERHIIETWTDWYVGAVRAVEDVEVGGASPETLDRIEAAVRRIETVGKDYAEQVAPSK
ncbi:MAG: M28 family peptidase [Rhodothermales bacterium]